MLLSLLTLITALAISGIAAYFSIIGLTAIFSAAFWPVAIMGGSLEVGKIVATVWMHRNWHITPLWLKTYLSISVFVLMLITSMGIFGFLSKAHMDQTLGSADNTVLIAELDRQIEQQKSTIDDANRVLTQLDGTVQTLIDAQRIRGNDGALAVRRSQTQEREEYSSMISAANAEIQRLQDQRLPLLKQQASLEAEVGPLKYIAALIYGDNPDANLLERAVRWVIIVLIVVFDPFALALVLAANVSLRNRKSVNTDSTERIVEVPGPERIVERVVEVAVPGPERVVEKVVEVPGPERVVEKVVEVPVPVVDTRESIVDLVELARAHSEKNLAPVDDFAPRENDIKFGTVFPDDAKVGDRFLRVDTFPTVLYKNNGSKWIEVKKAQNPSYLTNEYVNYLIEMLALGKFSLDDLTDDEYERVREMLEQIVAKD